MRAKFKRDRPTKVATVEVIRNWVAQGIASVKVNPKTTGSLWKKFEKSKYPTSCGICHELIETEHEFGQVWSLSSLKVSGQF